MSKNNTEKELLDLGNELCKNHQELRDPVALLLSKLPMVESPIANPLLYLPNKLSPAEAYKLGVAAGYRFAKKEDGIDQKTTDEN